MKTLSFLAAALCLAPLSNGAELETQTGNIIGSGFEYWWYYDSTLPDIDPDYDFYSYQQGDQTLSNVVIYNTGGKDYGVEGESHYQTNLSFGNSGSELLQQGPSLPDERFEISGHALIFDSEYLGELGAGTYTDGPPSGIWELFIKPSDGESVGDPVIVEIQAEVSGLVSTVGDGHAIAKWEVSAFKTYVWNFDVLYGDASTRSYGEESSEELFGESKYVKFATTIGSTFSLYTTFSLEIDGLFNNAPAKSTAKFDTIDISIRLIDLGCAADINSDGVIDTADLGLLVAHFGSSNPDADINGDGTVDSADLGLLIDLFGLPCD